jgi:hypothetical protein
MKKTALFVGTLAGIALAVGVARASAPPVGKLPIARIITQQAPRGSLVSLALPKATAGSVWRVARAYDGQVATEVEEHTLKTSVVVVFRATGSGRTAITYALTPSVTSSRALRAITMDLRVG